MQGSVCDTEIMSNTRLSIAMATYNGEMYVDQQLDSIARQSLLPDELVVSDDGSSDQTVQAVEDFARRSPFDVKIYRNKDNVGHAKNFERAISLTKGEIIVLCDQDDIWFPNKLEKVKLRFKSGDFPWVVINNAEIANKDADLVGINLFAQCRNLNVSAGQGCCISFLGFMKELYLPIPHGQYHDFWIKQLALLFHKVVYIPESLQIYRRHPTADSIAQRRDIDLTKKISLFDQYRIRRHTDSSATIQSWYNNLDLFALRILEKGCDIMPIKERINIAFESIERMRRILFKRQHLLTFGRFKKILSASEMLLQGEYHFFSGWKSFLKDILM